MSLIYCWVSSILAILQRKVVIKSLNLMKAVLEYLRGASGPSGYGSATTAQQVAQDCLSSSHKLTAIITGATSGIGAETARVLAKRGVRIVIPARDLQKAEELKESIRKENPEAEVIALEMDLSSFASIKRFCSEFLSSGLPLHILINNAGKYSHKLEFSEDNIELTFATNYLGHFLLTEMLLEKMADTASDGDVEGRIVNVSSVAHRWVKRKSFRFAKLLNPKSYNGTHAYAQSKLANILHAKELARQLKAKKANVTINAVHPGVVKTDIIRDYKGFITDSLYFLASKLLKSTRQGAATTCYAALSPRIAGVSGKYFSDCNEANCSALANEENEAQELWKQSHAFILKRLSNQPVLGQN